MGDQRRQVRVRWDATSRRLPTLPTLGGGGRQRPTGSLSVAHCIVQHGYTLWTSYQPASRFWAFQWIEGGWLFVVSGLLIAVTVGLVRRRGL